MRHSQGATGQVQKQQYQEARWSWKEGRNIPWHEDSRPERVRTGKGPMS